MNEQNLDQKRRTRSPLYPSFSLEVALEKAAILWEKIGKHDVSVDVVAQYWGYNLKSSSTFTSIATLKQFSILTDIESENGGTRKIQLTPNAIKLLYNPDKQSQEYKNLIKQVALTPKLYAELWSKYSEGLPDDAVIERYLVVERNFNERYVSYCVNDFKKTIKFAGLSEGDKSDKSLKQDRKSEIKNEEHEYADEKSSEETSKFMPSLKRNKPLATYQIPLGKNEASLSFFGDELVPEDFDALSDYVALFKKQFERKKQFEKIKVADFLE